jgi:predicted acylesterase/phospholipase RssA
MEESPYTVEDFAHHTAVCDLIMKGGIASGVVYPLAIAELAKRFRFSGVGGTSVGAHAAAVAAAAEYGRLIPGKGFVRLSQSPKEISEQNVSWLQPSLALRPLFDLIFAAIGGKGAGKLAAVAIRGFPWAAFVGVLPGVVVALAGLGSANIALLLLGLLLALVGLIALVGFAIWRMVSKGLPRNDYGLCPGIAQPNSSAPGSTDWLADLIDDIAGRDPKTDLPLTFGDLEKPDGRPKIELRMMTTNLTLSRPHSLPLTSAEYAFRLSEFEQLFPTRIVKYLEEHCQRAENPGTYDDLFKFPDAEHLPLIVAARMSASLPGLFSAVPLYARDFTLRRGEAEIWRRNLFSDGGLSSNFPIHFFDRMLPGWPTFAISLDEYDERRQPDGAHPPHDPRSRVWLADPKVAQSGILIPGRPINGVAGFLFRLVDAAKDWQDSLQSTLPGYRDRIVHINLKPGEGGLNFAMPAKVALSLASYGATAGITLRDEFEFDEHRWRRFLVAMERLDEAVEGFAAVHDGTFEAVLNKETELEGFEKFLDRYAGNPISYRQSAQDLEKLRERARALAELGRIWKDRPVSGEALPRPKAELRITPRT